MPRVSINGQQLEAAPGRLFRVPGRYAPLPALAVGLLMLWLLAGCANGTRAPIVNIFTDSFTTFAKNGDQAERAAEIPFASLSIDTGERSGLVVLGASSEPDTFWPMGHHGLVSLRHDGLQATAGLDEDLLDTRYRHGGQGTLPPWQQQTPDPFELTRTWQDTEGLMHRLSARGRLVCGPAQQRELPLATLALEPCALTLDWQDGSTTQGTLWRDPASFHLWAGEEQAWPDGPTIRWEVARQWW